MSGDKVSCICRVIDRHGDTTGEQTGCFSCCCSGLEVGIVILGVVGWETLMNQSRICRWLGTLGPPGVWLDNKGQHQRMKEERSVSLRGLGACLCLRQANPAGVGGGVGSTCDSPPWPPVC